MLQYLVTSKVRRRLLSLLWGERQHGSVSELAELAGVAFAGVHAEVKAMHRLQLVVARREGGKDVYAANFDHPDAAVLQALVATDARPALQQSDELSLRRKLASLGAPLQGVKPLAVSRADRMPTLLAGVQLARRDPTVARGLPLCFWCLRDELDMRRLEQLAFRAEDKHALGFFLELTAELDHDRRLLGLAEPMRDRRMTSQRDFFHTAQRAGVARDFALAAKWGFRMNMGLDSFQSLFDKLAA